MGHHFIRKHVVNLRPLQNSAFRKKKKGGSEIVGWRGCLVQEGFPTGCRASSLPGARLCRSEHHTRWLSPCEGQQRSQDSGEGGSAPRWGCREERGGGWWWLWTSQSFRSFAKSEESTRWVYQRRERRRECLQCLPKPPAEQQGTVFRLFQEQVNDGEEF